MEKKLYKRENGTTKKEKGDFKRGKTEKRELGWKNNLPENSAKGGNFFLNWKRNLFLAVFSFFLISLAIGGYYLFQAFYSEGIEVLLETPEGEIYFGVPFKVEAAIHNSSGKTLENVSVALSLPEGFSFTREEKGQKVITKTLGTVGNESLNKEEFEIVATASTEGTKRVEATVSYGMGGGSDSRYEEKGYKDINIENPLVFADIKIPEKVYSGENFEMEISYRNLMPKPAEGVSIEIEYPKEFRFISSKDKKSSDGAGRLFEFDSIPQEEEGKIIITGSVSGPDGSFFEVKAAVKREIYGEDYEVLKISKGFSINSSPLSLLIYANDSEDYIVKPGDVLKYALTYKNDTGTDLRDVIITAEISGAMFDVPTLNSVGFFNSINNTITWNASNKSELSLVPAGGTGEADFSIRVKDFYPIYRLSDKNFVLKVKGKIESPTVPEGVGADKTTAMAENQVKVRGKIGVESKVLLRDSMSGVVNEGAWPPKVDEGTEFTVHWILTNYATDVKDVSIKSFLNPGVKWKGNIKGNATTLPEYNERTQEIVWNVGDVAATKGVIGSPIEAVFQIEATPSILSLQNYVPLVGKTEAEAEDGFTGISLTAEDEGATTRLADDPMIKEGEGRVIK